MKIIKDKSFIQNTYLLDTAKGKVVIDPGYNYAAIKEELNGEKLVGILLTHFHFDHVACVDKLSNEFKIKAYIHKAEEKLITTDTLSALLGYAPVPVSANSIQTFEGHIEEFPEFIIHHMPGHSPGSVVFQWGSKYFTGDVLFKDGIGRTDFPGAEPEKQKINIDTFKEMGGNIMIYPGHGPEAKLKEIQEHNKFFKLW